MTKRDVLADNVDLLARAAGLIRQRPSYRLSVERKRTSAVVVSAASKVPLSKAGRRIARLDIYMANRPVVSIDAEDGAVPPTRVTIGRGRAVIKAQAWDQAGRLAAVCRTRIR